MEALKEKKFIFFNYGSTDNYLIEKDSKLPNLTKLYLDFEDNYNLIAPLAKTNLEKRKAIAGFVRIFLRLKISFGAKLVFGHSGVPTENITRSCYELIAKISDLWFTFEALKKNCEMISEKFDFQIKKSHCDFLDIKTLQKLKLNLIADNFSKQIFKFGAKDTDNLILIIDKILNITRRNGNEEVKRRLDEAKQWILLKKNLQNYHIFALAYALRNIYAHSGMAAKMGTENYKVIDNFYRILYFTLAHSTLVLANEFAKAITRD